MDRGSLAEHDAGARNERLLGIGPTHIDDRCARGGEAIDRHLDGVADLVVGGLDIAASHTDT